MGFMWIGCNHSAPLAKHYLLHIFVHVFDFIFYKIESQKQCIDKKRNPGLSRTWTRICSIPKHFQYWIRYFLISKLFQKFHDRGNPALKLSFISKNHPLYLTPPTRSFPGTVVQRPGTSLPPLPFFVGRTSVLFVLCEIRG